MDATERQDETGTDSPAAAQPPQPPARAGDEYLVPGPTAESNAGLLRWGVSWLIFSLALMLLMLGLSFVCWVLARLTNIA